MKHWLWKSLLLIMSAIIVLSMSGCSSSASGSGKVELKWLVRSDPHESIWEDQVIKDFEKTHPNIVVQLIPVPQAQIDQKMRTMIAGGNLPDIVAANWANGGFMSYQNQLLNLNTYVKKDPQVIQNVTPKTVNLWKVNGQLKALPLNTLGSFVFYNKDLLKKAGLPAPPTNWEDQSWTWDKMVSYAQKLTDPSKNVYGLLDNNDATGDAENFGGSFISKESYNKGVMLQPTVMSPIVREAVQAHHDLIFKDKVSPSASQLSAISQLGDPFVSGKVAMTINGGWGLWTYQDITAFKWGVAALPYVPNREDRMYVDIMSISKDSKHPDQAWEFMKYLYSTKSLKSYVSITQATPANQSLMPYWLNMETKKLGMSAASLKQLQDGAVKYGIESPNHMVQDWATLINYINQPMNAYFNGDKTLDAALKEANVLLNSWPTVKK